MSWFTKTESIPEPHITPAEELESLRELRRQAKAQFDADWKVLKQYLNTHPPERRMFFWNATFYAPVNFLKDVPAEQRALENRVAASKARWNTLQKQESDLEFALGLKR